MTDRQGKITVRGQEFPSAKACADHFGVTVHNVYYMRALGRADYIGLGKGAHKKRRDGKPVQIGPILFPSMRAASEELGYGSSYVRNVLISPDRPIKRQQIAFLEAAARTLHERRAERHE